MLCGFKPVESMRTERIYFDKGIDNLGLKKIHQENMLTIFIDILIQGHW